MVELVDTLDLGSSAERCASSTLALGTNSLCKSLINKDWKKIG